MQQLMETEISPFYLFPIMFCHQYAQYYQPHYLNFEVLTTWIHHLDDDAIHTL